MGKRRRCVGLALKSRLVPCFPSKKDASMGKRRRCGGLVLKSRLVPKGDLIQKILVRLPVKSLGRFKSVCKSWCALIQSSSFIDLHTTTTFNSSSSSASSSKFGSFVLLALRDTCCAPNYHISKEHSVIRLSEDESGGGVGGGGWRWWWRRRNTTSDDDYEDQIFKLDNNSNSGGGGSNVLLRLDSLGVPSCYQSCFYMKQIVGLCHGLVCLDDSDVDKICLWNPATKLHRILPKPIKISGDCPDRLVVFGFDVETKDYKVVLFSGFRSMYYRTSSPIECLCRVQVYSLSTNSWRLLEGITCLPGNPFHPTREGRLYLNGSCFFMAGFFHTQLLPCLPENNRFLISFDFTKEIITPIQLPDHHRDQELFLSYLGDKIALFTKYVDCDYEEYNIWVLNPSQKKNIWVLKEHSSSSSVNKESWTKLHTFQIKVKGELNIPQGISDDGDFALLETNDSTGWGKRMLLYNLATKQVEKKFLYCSALLSRAINYKPSLVSVIGGNGSSSSRRGSSSSSRGSR